jgi:hypothetical protein
MVFTIALLIVVILAVISLILTRRKFKQINTPKWVVPLTVCFLIFGTILMLNSANDINESINRKSWPTLMAKVIDTDIIGDRAYSPQLSCQYTVEDKVYTLITDLKTPGFGRKKTRRQTSEIILDDYPVGSTVRIRYNPENPSEAFIRTGPYWSDYLKISLGVLLAVLGIYGLSVVLIGKYS